MRAADPAGYGRLLIAGLPRLAHRAAYYLHYGTLPTGQVCHTCDNPPCCNPAHHYDGTALSNARDRERRRRRQPAVGMAHGRTVLTEDQVRRILQLRAGGCSYSAIAREVGTYKQQVARIVRGQVWGHISCGRQ